MIQIKDNQVIQTELPSSGYLANGESVSGYNLLTQEELSAEGWLPSEDIKPIYDEATQMLVADTCTIQADKVIVNYKAIEKPIDYAGLTLSLLGV